MSLFYPNSIPNPGISSGGYITTSLGNTYPLTYVWAVKEGDEVRLYADELTALRRAVNFQGKIASILFDTPLSEAFDAEAE